MGRLREGRHTEISAERPNAVAVLAERRLCALTWLLILGGAILLVLSGAEARPEHDAFTDPRIFGVISVTFATRGALLAARHPRNAVAWISCVAGVGWALSSFATEYAIYGLLAHPGSLPGGEAMAWLAEWTHLGAVLLLQLAPSPLTESSNLAIAGSTLAVAALFRPRPGAHPGRSRPSFLQTEARRRAHARVIQRTTCRRRGAGAGIARAPLARVR